MKKFSKPVLVFVLGGLLGGYASIGQAQSDEMSSVCAQLTAAYESVINEGNYPKNIVRTMASQGCIVPESPPDLDVDESAIAPEEVEPCEAGMACAAVVTTGPVVTTDTDPASVSPDKMPSLEQALAEQAQINSQNEAAISRISSAVYGNQIPSNIQSEITALTTRLARIEAEQSALRSRMERISGTNDQSSVVAQITTLQTSLAQVERALMQSNSRIGQLVEEQGSYRAMVSNYMDAQVVGLMETLGAGACTRVTISLSDSNVGIVTVSGSVWKEELHQAILDIPLLTFFQVEDLIKSGVGGLGCTEDFGDYQIALDPSTSAPLLADKPTAIEMTASLPASGQCAQLIADTSAAPEVFTANPRGFWVRDSEGFVEACLASDQRDYVVQRVTQRRDLFYILLLGDLS